MPTVDGESQQRDLGLNIEKRGPVCHDGVTERGVETLERGAELEQGGLEEVLEKGDGQDGSVRLPCEVLAPSTGMCLQVMEAWD